MSDYMAFRAGYIKAIRDARQKFRKSDIVTTPGGHVGVVVGAVTTKSGRAYRIKLASGKTVLCKATSLKLMRGKGLPVKAMTVIDFYNKNGKVPLGSLIRLRNGKFAVVDESRGYVLGLREFGKNGSEYYFGIDLRRDATPIMVKPGPREPFWDLRAIEDKQGKPYYRINLDPRSRRR